MSSDLSWQRTTLKKAGVTLIDCDHRTPPHADNGYPYIAIPQLKNGHINLDGVRLISKSDYLDWTKKLKPQADDVIVVRRCNSGDSAVVPRGLECAIGQNLVILRADGTKVNPKFLRWLIRGPDWWEQVKKFINVGAVFDSLKCREIPQYELLIPPLKEQKEIATILCALDDRIALLRETNTTLEAIAQALFKSWFVDFDPVRAKQQGREPEGMNAETAALFPDSFEESELGLVPSGWRVGALEDCCERVESGGTPKRSQADYWNGDIAWITSGEVRNTIVFESKEKITNLGVKESSAKIWPTGTTIIAMYGATAGEVCILANPATANQACCGLIPSKNARSFLFFCTRRERKDLASKSSGSAQQNLNKGLVCNHKIVLPSVNAVAAYEQVAGELLNGWIENERQAQTLTTLRDTLLPRLISGQLHLPEASPSLV